MKHINALPDVDHLRSFLRYDPNTGIVTWLINAASSVRSGSEAGTLGADGYLRIVINRKSYALHRVIWKLHYGSDPILRPKLHGEFACSGERPKSRPPTGPRPGRPKRASCTVCGKRAHGHGLCLKHYWRWRKHGDPLFVHGAREVAA